MIRRGCELGPFVGAGVVAKQPVTGQVQLSVDDDLYTVRNRLRQIRLAGPRIGDGAVHEERLVAEAARDVELAIEESGAAECLGLRQVLASRPGVGVDV